MTREFTLEQIREFVKKDYPSVSARMTKCLLRHFDQECAAKEKRIELLEEFVKQFEQDPYPEDVFLSIPAHVLEMIHNTLIEEYKMPLDRLTGYIGRRLRKPLADEAKQLLTPKT